MEIDFDTVKALSSPTRLEILDYSLKSEATPTKLSRELDKSKSTVSNHLEKLTEAGLLEKDSEEGRKRVVYRPTSQTRAIVKGRKRKMSFSLVTSLAGIGVGSILLLRALNPVSSLTGTREQMESAGADMMAQSADTATTGAEAASQSLPSEFLIFGALLVFGVSGVLMFVTWFFYRLKG